MGTKCGRQWGGPGGAAFAPSDLSCMHAHCSDGGSGWLPGSVAARRRGLCPHTGLQPCRPQPSS